MRLMHRFTLSDGSSLTRQERFVLKHLVAGTIADLKQEFGEAETDRQLRAKFLEELLTGGLKGVEIHRRGVLISNTVIQESLDLRNIEVAVSVALHDCIFKRSVSFRDSIIKKHLSLTSSQFFQSADFHRIKIEMSLFCRTAIFSGAVIFANATVGGQLLMREAKFLSEDYEADFNGITVGQNCVLTGAEFHGPADFSGANIKEQFEAQGAKFLSENYEANFNAIQVGLDAYIDGAEFHSSVDFAAAKIKRQLGASSAKFLSPDHKVSFSTMEVGQDAYLEGCDFHGLVSFVSVKIAGDLHLEPLLKLGLDRATTFRGGVNFRGAEIGGEFLATRVMFLSHGWVNFNAMQVGRDFSANGAVFIGPVNFTALQVKNNFYLDPVGRMKSFKTLFKGAANFSDVEVQGVFNADQAIFQSESVIFSGLKVGQGAFFIGTIFFGGLVLKEGQLTDLVIRGLHRLSKGGMPLDEIVLNRTRIAHRLTIENLEVKRFNARNLEVKGPAELRHLKIKTEADLRDAACHILQVVEVDWPSPEFVGKKTYLDGLTYQSLTTQIEPDKVENWRKLLDWLRDSRFNTRNFQEMDAFFQRAGLRKWADKIYIAGKRRALDSFRWWHPANWGTRFFWGVLAGFGRKPGRVFWPALALVLLGWLVFTPLSVNSGAMSPDWLGQFLSAHPAWTGFFVSLDRFLPGVDLGVARVCQPADVTVFVWFYWHFLKIMGWILAPIVVAAIYTKIK